MSPYFQKLILVFFVVTGFILQAPKANASASHFTVDEVIHMLNAPDQKSLLLKIAQNIYHRDKKSRAIRDKVCTHGQEVVTAWKSYGKKPSSVTSRLWSGIKDRKSLVIFTLPDVEGLVDKSIDSSHHAVVRTMGGDASSKIVIEVIFQTHEIVGQLYTDLTQKHQKKRTRENSKLENDYSEENLNHVKLLFDISDIVEELRKNKTLEYQDKFDNLGGITTICPTNV